MNSECEKDFSKHGRWSDRFAANEKMVGLRPEGLYKDQITQWIPTFMHLADTLIQKLYILSLYCVPPEQTYNFLCLLYQLSYRSIVYLRYCLCYFLLLSESPGVFDHRWKSCIKQAAQHHKRQIIVCLARVSVCMCVYGCLCTRCSALRVPGSVGGGCF